MESFDVKDFVIKNFGDIFSQEELQTIDVKQCFENFPLYQKVIVGQTNKREFFVCDSNGENGMFILFGKLCNFNHERMHNEEHYSF